MKVIHNSPSRLIQVPIDGNGSDIQEGALVMPGVTGEQDRSVFILATSAGADALGVLSELHDTSVSGDADPEAGTAYPLRYVNAILPGDDVAAELADDASNDVDVASATSTVITITSLEDNIDGAWVYVRAGTGVGQLGYIKASASGSFTLKSAMTTTLDNTSKVLILRPVAWQLVEIDSTGRYIKSTAAAGNLPWRVVRNEFMYQGQENWERLDPTKHHNLQLNGLSPKFRQILAPANTFYNPLD